MTLANGRQYLAIPGPSVVPDRVLNAMHKASPNIYTGDLIDLTHSIVPDLLSVARSTSKVAMYIANGHGAWEAALSNTLSRGDRVLILATGRFAIGWGEMAKSLGIDVQTLDFGKRGSVDAEALAKVLNEDKDHKITAVMAVQVDTSTSVRNDVPMMRDVLDQCRHPALLMLDCIACLGCDRFEMDAWGVDLMVAACQKGLMTPPGMSFVYFNDRADAARDTANCVTHYWDWRPRTTPEEYYQYFDGTAPTHHLFGLREALDMINEEGLVQVWARHETLAQAIWAALDAWGQNGPIEMNVKDPAKRSHAVTSVRIGAPSGTALRDWLTANAGVTLGIGLGMAPPGDPAWHGFFRIGHMGHVNAQMVMGVLGSMDAGLKALGLDHGAGALEAASRVLAKKR